jgi:eukaryotic-like serine/threonine-protein kinase
MDGVAQAGSTPAADKDVSVPSLVGGRYELGPLLGQGGNGRVYRAMDRSLRRRVAVKLLHDAEASAEHAARFEREISLQAGLGHANLIPVLDAGLDEGRRYLVMPLIQGTTLADRIVFGPLAGREARTVGVALAGALECVHAHGVVHRDVKPSNVLLGRDGQVFLADFGIACRRGEPDQAALPRFSMTGTAAYLAPEQVESGTIGYPGDVYALGLVLLEALTGVRAYRGPMLEQALARLWRQPEIPASLGPGWSELLGAMTARDSAQRPQPCRVAEALGAVESPPPSSASAHRWARSARRRAATSTARRARGGGPSQVY